MEKHENGMPILPKNHPVVPMPRCGEGGGCGEEMSSCENRQLASVYAPLQKWQMLFPKDKALMHGTLFEELYMPLEVSRNG